MAAKHWLIGCGLGCGAIVLIFLVISAVGTFFLRDTMSGFDSAVETRETLDERFGAVREFTPPLDGAIPADRMEAFLAVREANSPARETVAQAFESISTTAQEARELESKPLLDKVRSIFGIVGSAADFGGDIAGFFDARNRAMLEHDIGMGEYTYIYVLAYYSWLERSPGDAPGNARVNTRSGNISIGRGRGAPQELGDIGNSRISSDVLSMLQNQLDALPEETDDSWREELAAESEMLERDSDRLPWQDGVPAPILASLEPFRERLEAAYNPSTNAFELLRNKRRGLWSIQAE